MAGERPPDAEQPLEGGSVHLHAEVSGEARVYQAGRDQHLHYQDGVREAHRVESATVVEECPYPGLAAFSAEEARWFFGRDGLTARLVGWLADRLAGGGALVVVAPS